MHVHVSVLVAQVLYRRLPKRSRRIIVDRRIVLFLVLYNILKCIILYDLVHIYHSLVKICPCFCTLLYTSGQRERMRILGSPDDMQRAEAKPYDLLTRTLCIKKQQDQPVITIYQTLDIKYTFHKKFCSKQRSACFHGTAVYIILTWPVILLLVIFIPLLPLLV